LSNEDNWSQTWTISDMSDIVAGLKYSLTVRGSLVDINLFKVNGVKVTRACIETDDSKT